MRYENIKTQSTIDDTIKKKKYKILRYHKKRVKKSI
jgi:hypothetical protein